MKTFAYNSVFFILLGTNGLISAIPNPNVYTTSTAGPYAPDQDYPQEPDYGSSSTTCTESTAVNYPTPNEYYTPTTSDYYNPSPTPEYNSYEPSGYYPSSAPSITYNSEYSMPYYHNTTTPGNYYVTATPSSYYPASESPAYYSGCSASICYDFINKCGQMYGGCTLAPECGGPASPTWSSPYCSLDKCTPTTYTTTYTTTYEATETETTTITDYTTVTEGYEPQKTTY